MFGIENNFVREMNPEFPRSIAVCYALVIWVGLQAVVLHQQGKWGARFMIPARSVVQKSCARPYCVSLCSSYEPLLLLNFLISSFSIDLIIVQVFTA